MVFQSHARNPFVALIWVNDGLSNINYTMQVRNHLIGSEQIWW